MTKAVALIAFALCILAIAANVQGQISKFSVEGEFFCATCRGNAGTIITHLENSTKEGRDGVVEIKCRSRKNGTVTLVQPVGVDDGGFWTTDLDNGHEDDICTVAVVTSPDPQCNVKVPGFRGVTINRSDAQDYQGRRTFYVRNKIGFVDNKSLPNCRKVKSKSGKLIPAVTLPWI